jgi:hypothetical protein
MRTFLVALFCLVVPGLASPTPADRTAYSHSFQFNGTCTGHDMWNQWTVAGEPAMPDSFVRPFADQPINVIGYELLLMRHDYALRGLWRRIFGHPISWFMVGSTIQADAMVSLGSGETRSRMMWPAGVSQPWPSRQDAKPVSPVLDKDGKMYAAGGHLLDLHGVCPKGDSMEILLTIYYTPAEPQPSDTPVISAR